MVTSDSGGASRRIFHFLLGALIVALLYTGISAFIGDYLPLAPLPPAARPILLTLVAGAVLVVAGRKYRLPLVCRLLERFGKPDELKKFPGKSPFFYVLSAFILVCVFDNATAMAALAILAVGDTVSHVVGVRFGKTLHPLSRTKCLEGTLAGAAAAAFAAMLFVLALPAIISAFAAMFVEGIDPGRARAFIDDNLTVPVTAALVIYIMARII